MRALLIFGACMSANISNAAVSERLVYTYYNAKVSSSRPLLFILNESTPHRERERVFHAYTSWSVKWKLFLTAKTDGRCRVKKVKTQFLATIDLPKLAGANPAQISQFEKYLPALREHELGHYYIGREAAEAIDNKIGSLQEMRSCAALKSIANKLAYQTSDEYKALELQYDSFTENGKLQGVELGWQ